MATEQQLADWTAASGRDWNQLCQAYIYQICNAFGIAPVVYGSALDAYYASDIVSTDIYSAPPGSITFWDIGSWGHVGTQVDAGNAMGSSRVLWFWGQNAGETELANYMAQTGAWPLGWAYTNGQNSYPFEPTGGTGHMPLTDADAQTVVNTQIILDQPWGQASLAVTVSGIRTRVEQILESNTRIERMLEQLLGSEPGEDTDATYDSP